MKQQRLRLETGVLVLSALAAGVACTPLQVPAQGPVATTTLLSTPLSEQVTPPQQPLAEATTDRSGEKPVWWADTAYETLSNLLTQVQGPYFANHRGWIYLSVESYQNPAAIPVGTVSDPGLQGLTVVSESWQFIDDQGYASQYIGRNYQADQVLADQTMCNELVCVSTQRGDYARPDTTPIDWTMSVDRFLTNPAALVEAMSVPNARDPLVNLRVDQTQTLGELDGRQVLIIASVENYEPVTVFANLPEAVGTDFINQFDLETGRLLSSDTYWRFVDDTRILMYSGKYQTQLGLAPPNDLLEAFQAWEETK